MEAAIVLLVLPTRDAAHDDGTRRRRGGRRVRGREGGADAEEVVAGGAGSVYWTSLLYIAVQGVSK